MHTDSVVLHPGLLGMVGRVTGEVEPKKKRSCTKQRVRRRCIGTVRMIC